MDLGGGEPPRAGYGSWRDAAQQHQQQQPAAATLAFRGVEHTVRVATAADGTNSLTVEVENRLTADRWHNRFDEAYIEELTSRTGSFKTAVVFQRMLKTALGGSSDSLALDLLTPDDLERLRHRRGGGGGSSSVSGGGASASPAPSDRRYLILTYRSEFDKVHYPLPLQYSGKPDPAVLQRRLQSMQHELERLRASHAAAATAAPAAAAFPDARELGSLLQSPGARSFSRTESAVAAAAAPAAAPQTASDRLRTPEYVELLKQYADLRRDHEAVVRERDDLLADVAQLAQDKEDLEAQLAAQQAAPAGGRQAATELQAARKEIRMLKKMVAGLEQDVLEQKNKFQHQLQRRGEQLKDLKAELDTVRASENNLRMRCRSLTNDIANRARRTAEAANSSGSRGRRSTPSGSAARRRTSSAERRAAQRASVERLSAGRPASGGRHPRSSSAPRSRSRSRSQPRASNSAAGRTRSPSPAGRFDPTAYVRAREQKLQAARARREQSAKRRGRSTTPRGRTGGGRRARSGSVESVSSVGSLSSIGSATSRGSYDGRPANGARSAIRRPQAAGLDSPSYISSASGDVVAGIDSDISVPSRDAGTGTDGGGVFRSDQGLAGLPAHTSAAAAASSSSSRYFRNHAEISDIDARLRALQGYLKSVGAH